ncbi:MAG: hypothetical protein J6L85_07625 [Clostridia bacterium]|nr:hypothetical protein [Clostridia bacterium]
MRLLKRVVAIFVVCGVLATCFVGCAKKGKPLLKLGDNEISVNLFELYLSRMKGTLCSAEYFGASAKQDEFWDTVVDAYEKTTYNTVYTDMVLDTAKSYIAALALFDERGLELPDSYIEEIDAELEELIESVAEGSKTTFNTMLAEYGANYDVLREAYIIEAKIAYLREDIFGINGSKVSPDLIEKYYQDTYACFKQVFLYTYDPVYVTDENGDNIYYTAEGNVSYDTTKTQKKDENGNPVYDTKGDRVYVYTDENGKERIAYKIKDATRKPLIDSNGDPVKRHYEGDELKLVIEEATMILEQVKENDTIGFDLLVEEHTQDETYESYPDGYYLSPTTAYPVPEVQETLFELGVGQYKMVRSENGLHIIMRYKPAVGAYALDAYENLFIAKSTGTYIFMNDLVSKLMTDYVASYKDSVEVDESLLDGIDIKGAGINLHY